MRLSYAAINWLISTLALSLLYLDLGAVSDIMLESFYTSNDKRSPWRHLFRMAELNRLQQNFPYGDDQHFMLIAISKVEDNLRVVAGFCDVDMRPPSKIFPSPPRPYLSDLAVRESFRQQGIAKALIEACENIVLRQQWRDLYIRVEQKNDVAIQMYNNLQYKAQNHPVFGVKDTTTLLHKELVESNKNDTSAASVAGNNTVPVLDYVV